MKKILNWSGLISVIAFLGACATHPMASGPRKPASTNGVVNQVGCSGWGWAKDGKLLHGSADVDFSNQTGNYLEALPKHLGQRTEGDVGVAKFTVTLNQTVATDFVKATLHLRLRDNTTKDVDMMVGYASQAKINVPLGDGNMGDIQCSGIALVGDESTPAVNWRPSGH